LWVKTFGDHPTVFVLEVETCWDHSLLLVSDEGNVDAELRQFLEFALCVALLPLLHSDGDVVLSLRVVESKNCASSCEELGES
jgi:hypothetical protein